MCKVAFDLPRPRQTPRGPPRASFRACRWASPRPRMARCMARPVNKASKYGHLQGIRYPGAGHVPRSNTCACVRASTHISTPAFFDRPPSEPAKSPVNTAPVDTLANTCHIWIVTATGQSAKRLKDARSAGDVRPGQHRDTGTALTLQGVRPVPADKSGLAVRRPWL